MSKIDTKYLKTKIKNLEQKLDSQKYNTKNKNTKNLRNIYEVHFKNRAFFLQDYSEMKMKIKE